MDIDKLARAADPALTFDDYLKRYESYEGARTEWLDGQVMFSMTNNPQHQRIIHFLTALVEYFLDVRSLGLVIPANVPMKIDERTAPEPDLMVLLAANTARVRPQFIEGAADIVVDVVSPESDERDYGRNRLLYEAAGVPDYWLIDPLREQVLLFTLANGLYRQRPLDAAGRITSPMLPAFALDAALLWRDKLPNARDVVMLVEAMDTGDGA